MINNKAQLKFLLTLLVGTLILSFFIFSPFLAPLVLAAVFAVVLHPLYMKLLRHLGGRETLATLITVIISILCILVPLTLIGNQIFREAAQLYGFIVTGDGQRSVVTSTIQNLGQRLDGVYPGASAFLKTLSADVDVYAKQGLEWLIGHLGSALSSISALFLDLFIFLVALYYLLRDGSKLKQTLIELSPLNDSDDEMVFGRLGAAISSVVKGNLMIALLQGILTSIGFTIFGIPSAILWGTVTAVAALIPGVGTALVIVPGVIYLFVSGHAPQGIGLIIWGTLAVGLIDNFLGPKLVGGGMRLHPLLVLLSVLGGIAFFGPIGIFLGPLTLSLLLTFMTIYSYLTKSGTAG